LRSNNGITLRSNKVMPTLALMMLTAILLLAASQALAASQGFRSPHLLQDHYSRFGKQFGNITIEQYLRLAQQLRDATPGRRQILVSKRSDGGGSKFDIKHGWFVAFDGDGTLRTFFVPKDGIRFFEAQQKSSAPPE
jgi:pyocin large subunit-like protein